MNDRFLSNTSECTPVKLMINNHHHYHHYHHIQNNENINNNAFIQSTATMPRNSLFNSSKKRNLKELKY